jgi:hypothetical protein
MLFNGRDGVGQINVLVARRLSEKVTAVTVEENRRKR